ncbi:hypothetical protein K438DRAFT_1759771 [Mycena galopus ATCC 62051]|nr:hypothetical protein K438DRAFT_1759771 [Mycena galopus ATCC 62051]
MPRQRCQKIIWLPSIPRPLTHAQKSFLERYLYEFQVAQHLTKNGHRLAGLAVFTAKTHFFFEEFGWGEAQEGDREEYFLGVRAAVHVQIAYLQWARSYKSLEETSAWLTQESMSYLLYLHSPSQILILHTWFGRVMFGVRASEMGSSGEEGTRSGEVHIQRMRERPTHTGVLDRERISCVVSAMQCEAPQVHLFMESPLSTMSPPSVTDFQRGEHFADVEFLLFRAMAIVDLPTAGKTTVSQEGSTNLWANVDLL